MEDAGAPRGRILVPAFVLVCTAAFMEFLGVGITIIALPRFVIDELHRSDLAVGAAVGVFAAGALGVRPFAGRWGDAIGRRALLVAGLLVTAAALLATGLVRDYAALVALRVVAGVGQALFFVGGTTLAADLAPAHRRGEALSLFTLPVFAGLGVGPVVSEALAARGAATAFVVAGGIVALGLVVTPFVKEPARVTAPRDQPAAGKWVHRAALGPGTVVFLGVLGFIGFQAYLPLYADEIDLARPGMVFLAYSGVLLTVRLVGARLPDRLGANRSGTLATTGIAAGFAVIAAVPSPGAVYAGVCVLAAGMALQYPALMSLALGRAPDYERARVVSTFTGFFDLAQAGGGVLLGAIAAMFGYRAAFAGGAVAALLALCLLQLRVARPTRPVRVDDEPDAWAPAGAE